MVDVVVVQRQDDVAEALTHPQPRCRITEDRAVFLAVSE